jgi:hypothetical protein
VVFVSAPGIARETRVRRTSVFRFSVSGLRLRLFEIPFRKSRAVKIYALDRPIGKKR